MNVSRRRYMGEKGGSSPYQRIEYLESTGTQYIDTGIKASGNLSIRISLIDYFTEQHKGTWPFGGRDGYQNNMFGMSIDGNNGSVYIAYDNKSIARYGYTYYPSSCLVEIGGGIIKINNVEGAYTQRTFISNYNLILCGLNNGGTIISKPIKIGTTFISNGTTTLDLVPVRIGTTGYMYDTISGTLLGNAGTGDFILGPDIN